MPRLDRVKRQLVSEVVRENIEALRGLPPRPLRRARRTVPRRALRSVGLVIAPSLLFVLISVITTGQAERPPAVARPAATPAAPSAVVPVAESVESLPAPVAINPAAFPLEVRKIVLDP